MKAIQRFIDTYSILFKRYWKLLRNILTVWIMLSTIALFIIFFIIALFKILGFLLIPFWFLLSFIFFLISIDLGRSGKSDEYCDSMFSNSSGDFLLIVIFIIVFILILFMTVFNLLFFDQIPQDTWQWLRFLRLSNADCLGESGNERRNAAGEWLKSKSLSKRKRSMETAILGGGGLMRPL